MEFKEQKQEMINELTNLLEKYNEFTKKVSPKNYRTTGEHFSAIRNMREDIQYLEEITDVERDSEIYRKNLEYS